MEQELNTVDFHPFRAVFVSLRRREAGEQRVPHVRFVGVPAECRIGNVIHQAFDQIGGNRLSGTNIFVDKVKLQPLQCSHYEFESAASVLVLVCSSGVVLLRPVGNDAAAVRDEPCAGRFDVWG